MGQTSDIEVKTTWKIHKCLCCSLSSAPDFSFLLRSKFGGTGDGPRSLVSATLRRNQDWNLGLAKPQLLYLREWTADSLFLIISLLALKGINSLNTWMKNLKYHIICNIFHLEKYRDRDIIWKWIFIIKSPANKHALFKNLTTEHSTLIITRSKSYFCH